MKAPDLVAVEEIQDNNGDVGRRQPGRRRVADVGGPDRRDRRRRRPALRVPADRPGRTTRTAARRAATSASGFLFRTDRGLEFVDRGDAGPTDADGRRRLRADGPQLTLSPGRIDAGRRAWTASRKPLAGEFRWRGRTVFAIGNHFSSKGGDDPLFGHFQPPVRHTEIGPDAPPAGGVVSTSSSTRILPRPTSRHA